MPPRIEQNSKRSFGPNNSRGNWPQNPSPFSITRSVFAQIPTIGTIPTIDLPIIHLVPIESIRTKLGSSFVPVVPIQWKVRRLMFS